jgi:hypothetical protein
VNLKALPGIVGLVLIISQVELLPFDKAEGNLLFEKMM